VYLLTSVFKNDNALIPGPDNRKKAALELLQLFTGQLDRPPGRKPSLRAQVANHRIENATQPSRRPKSNCPIDKATTRRRGGFSIHSDLPFR
jgi:hypothetical protein